MTRDEPTVHGHAARALFATAVRAAFAGGLSAEAMRGVVDDLDPDVVWDQMYANRPAGWERDEGSTTGGE